MDKFCKHCGANIETSPCSCATTQATVASQTGDTPAATTQATVASQTGGTTAATTQATVASQIGGTPATTTQATVASQTGGTPVSTTQTTTTQVSSTAQAMKDVATQSVKDVAGMINIDQEKAEQLVNNAKTKTQNILNLCKNTLKNNNAAINIPASSTENANRIALAITQLLIIVIVTHISLSPLSSFISFGTRFITSILVSISCSSFIVAPAGIVFLAARKKDPSTTFVDICGVFSTATLLPCILFLVITLLSKISILFGMFFSFTVVFSLIVNYYEAILVTTGRTKDQSLRTLCLAYAATAISLGMFSVLTLAIVGQQIAYSVMNSLEGMINSLMYLL